MSASDGQVRTYYGQPVLKQPEWTYEVPWYLFFGGLAGASSALAHFARGAGHERTADRMTLLAAGAGAVAGPVLLISDLGRPRRFLNMLRVFKPTSAMSVGSWLLAAYSGVAAGAAVLQVTGLQPGLRRLAGTLAGALGMPLATYTAVLMADSSIPVWYEARGELPYVFAGSAAASAGGAGLLLAPPSERAGPRRLAVMGAVLELAANRGMRRRMSAGARELGAPDVGQVYHEGDAGRYGRAAEALTATGAALVALASPRRAGRRRASSALRTGAVLLLAGSVCQRWSVYRAGFQSAADPRYVVGPQRARVEARGRVEG